MDQFIKNREYFNNSKWTVEQSQQEIEQGLALINSIKQPIVTFFGSHRIESESPYYKHAKDMAYEFGKDGYAVLSGGGPGIMHAANSGAMEAGAPSIGLKASLLTKEEINDPIFTHELSFHFFFARRFIMSIKSEALIFYPGGYGTLNELFEYAVLMQTGVVDTVPIICINKDYWTGLLTWLHENPLEQGFFIDPKKDLGILHFLDNFEDIRNLLAENDGHSAVTR